MKTKYKQMLKSIILLIVLFLSSSNLMAIQQVFSTTWNTSNGKVTIPTNPALTGTYNYNISWTNLTHALQGNGSASAQTGNYTITGLTNGDSYKIVISGDFPSFYWNGGSHFGNLLTIEQWGEIDWKTFENAFKGCVNVQLNASDVPRLTQVTNLNGMFSGCTNFTGNSSMSSWNVSTINDMSNLFCEAFAFNQNIGNWNVSNVTNMSGLFELATSFNQNIASWNTINVTNMYKMFSGATSFNQNISNWNTSNVSFMKEMFYSASSFNQNVGNWSLASIPANSTLALDNMFSYSGLDCSTYSSILTDWAANLNTPDGLKFGAINIYYNLQGQTSRNILTTSKNWTITDAGFNSSCPNAFITTWMPTSEGEITIPLFPGSAPINYSVTCDNLTNPGVNEYVISGQTGNCVISGLSVGDVYRISILGDFPHFYINNSTTYGNLLTIEQWGDIQWKSFYSAFKGCPNLQLNATDIPDLTQVTSLRAMFQLSSNFTGHPSMNNWDTSSVTNMTSMFSFSTSFNQDIGNWNTSAVTDMTVMFDYATSFNQNISNWNTSNVTSMYGMFRSASAFNQNIGNWSTSNVTTMQKMFEGASFFNQNIGNWDLSSIPDNSTTAMLDMLTYSGLDCNNYGATLNGWASNANSPDNITLSADGLKFNLIGQAAKNTLTNTKGWIITDAGYNASCVTTSLNNNSTKNIRFYPNPVIDFVEFSEQISNVKIFDVTGKILKSIENNTNKIDFTTFPKGIYFLKAKIGEILYTEKIVKK